MSERERLIAVLEGRTPDKTPWYADLDYLYGSLKQCGRLDARYHGEEGFIRFHECLGAGACFYYPVSLWKTEYTGGVHYSEREHDGYRICEYLTPSGSIRSVQKYLSSTYSWAYCEHFIKTIEDLRIMLYIFEQSRYAEDFDAFKRIDTLWGGSGLLTGIGPASAAALQKLLTRWAGVETTIELYSDYTEEFREICIRIENTEDEVFEILERSPARYIELAENLSGEITGKSLFEEYNAPYYKKRTEQLHAAGKFVGIHIDGTLKPCFSMLKACGFDVAEAVTPMPVGDVALENLRQAAGDGIVIWGGLPGALFSPVYSDREFTDHLKKIFDIFPIGSGFVLGVADQVPPDAVMKRVESVRRMIDG